MNKQKENFELNDFLLNVVKMEVNFNNIHFLTYFLLVDENSFIHDYKIQVNENTFIKPKTTTSHEKWKAKSLSLDKRLLLIKNAGAKHCFGDGVKDAYSIPTKLINEINEWLIKDNWRDITFQNIEYIFLGSNASGRGRFTTDVDTIDYKLSFFLKDLNISKNVSNIYQNIDYTPRWKKFIDSNFQDCKSFKNWIDNDKDIKHFFIKYKTRENEWETTRKEFEKAFAKRKEKFNKTETLVSIERRKFSTSIDKEFKILKNDKLIDYLLLKFFDIQNNTYTKYQKAHIKPVWLIKNEYMKNNNENHLKQISDINNFLPLPSNIHELYDNKYFYWDTNGTLVTLNSNLKENEIQHFRKINHLILKNETVNYIEEYIKKIVNKMNLVSNLKDNY